MKLWLSITEVNNAGRGLWRWWNMVIVCDMAMFSYVYFSSLQCVSKVSNVVMLINCVYFICADMLVSVYLHSPWHNIDNISNS